MSQAKVDARKEYKKNREKFERIERRKAWIRRGIALLIVAFFVAWGGYSAYVAHEDKKPHKEATVNYQPVSDYLDGLEAHEHDHAEETTDQAQE